MTQQQQPKKPMTHAQATAKIGAAGQAAAQRASEAAYSAAETTRKSAQNVVNISANAMRDMLSGSSTGMRDTQERMMEMSREGMENFSKSADACTRMMTEAMSIARGNVDACVESCNITANVAKDMGNEMAEAYNRAFSDCVEITKEAFNCRTINDMVELQNKAFRSFMDNYFAQSSRICNMVFECCTDAMEPINERVTEASEQMSKAMAA